MFKQMRYFIAVVETKNFTKAADLCYISQSAISQQIKSLEDTLDTKLLIRNKKSLSLTPSGEYFYQHCQKILKEVDELCKKTKEIEDDENVLRIGYLRGYPGKELRESVLEFSSMYPDIIIDLVRGNHEELYELIQSEKASLVISDQRRVFHEDYVNYHLLHMDCYVEVSSHNPLSEKEYLDVKDCSGQTCILVATKTQQDIEKEFYENIIGLKCHYIFASDIEEARLLVAMNRGIMPIENVKKPSFDLTNIKAIPLYRNQQHLQRNYCAFWQKARTNYYIEEFAEILRQKMRSYHNE